MLKPFFPELFWQGPSFTFKARAKGGKNDQIQKNLLPSKNKLPWKWTTTWPLAKG
ncbi:MAG: hypothetical protein IJS50_01735 [Desulfovibrio sp.]|nr:hypothetical protein [Desulfovibrio sp.]